MWAIFICINGNDDDEKLWIETENKWAEMNRELNETKQLSTYTKSYYFIDG